MKKLRRVDQRYREEAYTFHCPGCGYSHIVTVRRGPTDQNPQGPTWSFNGDLEKPTFQPSLLMTDDANPAHGMARHVCHSFIRDGKIEFLPDCTHKLAGQTVPMEDVE